MLMAGSDTDGLGRVEAERRAAERCRQREAPGPKWYIVQCGRRTDQQALDAFGRFKIETYYPTVTEFKPMARRRLSQAQRRSGIVVMEPREVAVFPRYVFSRIDLKDQDSNWREAFDYAGVGGLMCHSGMPVWMPDEAIKRVRDRVGHQIHTTDTMRAFLAVGDEVFVNHGPFASFPGIVEQGLDIPIEKLDASMRIKVAVNIFGRATPVELEYWQVSKRSD
ncbi:MAG: transcription termination/antitermination NusG family protein [Bradyrhizobium sp.]|uniref:transcription termination/antitermination protein NusG n=1 Tax=Bradyrhizobium sp. TaxID=376 RepID=UPI00272EFB78|nr:transcription termination/antitermination NusG family protein [Bradyrhizobium sp.]MDP1866987.1 transcription termination/antitermination NusG family protein [Bradyrhizobium sp.]